MTPQLDQVQQQIRSAIQTFDRLGGSDDPPNQVIAEALEALVSASGSEAAVAWMPTTADDPTMQPVGRAGQTAVVVGEDGAPLPAVAQALEQAWSQRKVVVVAPSQSAFADTALHNATQFYVPVEASSRSLGVLHLINNRELDPKSYRDYVAFAQKAALSLGLYLVKRKTDLVAEDAAGASALLRVVHQLLQSDEPADVLSDLANLCRPQLNAQRAAAVGYWADRPEVVFSDVVDTNRKAVLVKTVEQLADAARQRKTPLSYRRDQTLDGEDELLGPLIDQLFSVSKADAVTLTPMYADKEIVGVVVAEYAQPDDAARRAGLQQEISRQAGPILARSAHWHRRPLRKLSNLLWSVKRKPASAARKAAIVVGILLALLVVLFFVPVPLYVRADARLEPMTVASLSAPLSATVESVNVRQGDRVREGDRLMEMDYGQLQLELAGVVTSIKQQKVMQRSAEDEAANGNKKAVAQARAAQLRVEQLEIERQRIKRRINRSTITAPMDGRVLSDHPEQLQGMMRSEGDPLMQLADLTRFYLVIEVDEADIGLISQSIESDRSVPVTFLSHVAPDQPHETQIEALSSVAPTSTPNATRRRPVYDVTVPITLTGPSTDLALANPTGRAKLHVGSSSIAYRYGRRAWRFVQMTLLF